MHIQPFYDKDTATFSYIVACKNTGTCAIIDPVQDFDFHSGRTSFRSADALLDWSQKKEYNVAWILETHIHADHLSAAHYLQEKTGALIGIGSEITQVLTYWVPFFGTEADTPLDGRQFDRLLEDTQTLPLGDLNIRVMSTPGHTPACVSYQIKDAIFTGDTIFNPSLGTARADFPGGNARTLYQSILKILALPEDTRIFIGHDYPTPGGAPQASYRVDEQKKNNKMVNDTIDEERYISLRQSRDAQLAMPKLLLPSIQVNLRAGSLGASDATGRQYIRLPLNQL